MIHKLFENKKHLLISILSFNLYFFLYYWSIGYLHYNSKGLNYHVFWLRNQVALLLKSRSPFLFEPIGRITLFKVEFLVAPLNILIGLLLGFLVFINILSVFYMNRLPKQCRVNHRFSGLLGILPSFLTGFACCAPTFLIPLAATLGSSVVVFTKLAKWFLPLSVLLLLFGTFSSLLKIQKTLDQ